MKKHLRNFLGLGLLIALCQPMIAQCPAGGGGGGGGSTPSFASSSTSLASFNSVGQTQGNLNDLYSRVRLNQSYTSSTQSFYASTEGNPYLYDEFQVATIVLNDDREIRDVEVNYDGYAGEMIAIDEDGDKIILDSRFYKEVIVDTKDGPAVFSKPNPKHSDKFYQVLYDIEGLAFFKEEKVSVREGMNSGIINKPDRFVKRTKYYVVSGDNEAVAVNLKKRELFDYFPEIELAAINEILKTKKFKLKKEKDYLALFAQL